jgi:hypothetical protein
MGRFKKPPELTQAEWQFGAHAIARLLGRRDRVLRGLEGRPPMSQDEFARALHDTVKLNEKRFPRGMPKALEKMKRQDDGIIAMIERKK